MRIITLNQIHDMWYKMNNKRYNGSMSKKDIAKKEYKITQKLKEDNYENNNI